MNLGTSVFSIVNTTNGLQQIRIWTQAVPNSKFYTDLGVKAQLQGDYVFTYVYKVNITNACSVTTITTTSSPNWIYYTGRDSINLLFVWSETVGLCGPIIYSCNQYLPSDTTYNNTLDSSIFTYPSISNTINTIQMFTSDFKKAGLYYVRVYASLGVGGFKQNSIIYSIQVIQDPCSYFPFTLPFLNDVTLWVNETNQIVLIP